MNGGPRRPGPDGRRYPGMTDNPLRERRQERRLASDAVKIGGDGEAGFCGRNDVEMGDTLRVQKLMDCGVTLLRDVVAWIGRTQRNDGGITQSMQQGG